jgi:hypothetical protein
VREQSAVHRQHVAVDEPRSVGGQEHHGVRDVFGRAGFPAKQVFGIDADDFRQQDLRQSLVHDQAPGRSHCSGCPAGRAWSPRERVSEITAALAAA